MRGCPLPDAAVVTEADFVHALRERQYPRNLADRQRRTAVSAGFSPGGPAGKAGGSRAFHDWEPLARTAIGTRATYIALIVLLRIAVSERWQNGTPSISL